jgi:uncharacterized membrane protein
MSEPPPSDSQDNPQPSKPDNQPPPPEKRARQSNPRQPQAIPIPPQVLAQILARSGQGIPPGIGIPIAFPTTLPVAQTQQTVQLWQGQYPPPEAIEHYEKVLPGSFNRMITMAEQLQEAQIAEAKRANEYTKNDSRRGHWLGFMTAITAMGCALVSLYFGYPWVSSIFISVPVMGVAKALVDSAKQSSPSEMIAAATGGANVEEQEQSK